MVAATSTEAHDYSTDFDCHVCLRPDFFKKAGAACEGCPAFTGTHYFPRGEGVDAPDVLVVGDVPELPALALLKRNEGVSSFFHQAFTDDGGKVVKAAVAQLQADVPSEKIGGMPNRSPYFGIGVRYVYAVKCAVDKPSKDVVDHCNTPLLTEVGRVVEARQAAGRVKPLIVLATGAVALRALGVQVQNFERDAAGRVFEVDLGKVPIVIVATMSLKAMAAQAGKASSIVSDVRRAFDLVRGQVVRTRTREEVEAGYVYPYTNAEVAALVDEILAYSENGVDPMEWAISFDTETNTLHPHRDGTKWITATFSWAEGKACSIALDHPHLHDPQEPEQKDENGEVVRPAVPSPYAPDYDPRQALEDVKRLLHSRKPKIGHNVAKYDQKVAWKYGVDIANIRWDCLLAEHALEEDKKGQYGLKYLVKQFIPELSGYEDKLHEYLDKEEGEDQGTSIRAKQAADAEETPLPKLVQEALDRCELTPKFQAGNLEKQLKKVQDRLANREMIEMTVQFFAHYKITPPFKGRTFTKAWKKLQERAREIKEAGTLPAFVDIAVADIAVVERLSEVEDFTVLEPIDPKEEQFVKDAELLLQAKRAGEFVKKAEKKKAKTETDGGFENIPIRELNFYGAVDADATRRLAVLQRMRMRNEDRTIVLKRRHAEFDLKHARGLDRRYKIEPLCDPQDALVNLHRNRYLPRARALADMEYRGVKIDRQYLQDSKIELDNVVNRTEAKIYEMAGEQFKINSAQQLGRFLFDTGVGFVHPDPDAVAALAANPEYADKVFFDGKRASYRFVSKTVKGAVQVNEKTFRTYLNSYSCPFSDLILLYKKAVKARDTFLKNIELLSVLDGYIHTNFNLNGTSTGRLSSNNINLQNIPKGTLGAIVDKQGKLVLDVNGRPVAPGVVCKRLFIPDDDSYALVNADAKGAEVSIFSAYSKDAGLIQALREGRDAHCYFSAKTLDPAKIGAGLTGEARRVALAQAGIDDDHAWSYEDFYKGKDGLLDDKEYGKRLKKLRDNIKRVVFGILFGAGARKIAEIAGIKEDLAQTIIKALFEEFKSIPAFVEQTKWELRTFGFVETYHGRRRRFHWNPRTAPKKMLAKAERQAVNFKIQGTNSDIILDVLCAVREVLERDMKGRMLLTVHDSLVFQVPKRYVHQVKDMLHELGTKRVARMCPWLPVDFKWDIEAGPSYGKLQGIDDYVKSLPQQVLLDEPQGFTEEEMLAELRDTVWEREEGEPELLS